MDLLEMRQLNLLLCKRQTANLHRALMVHFMIQMMPGSNLKNFIHQYKMKYNLINFLTSILPILFLLAILTSCRSGADKQVAEPSEETTDHMSPDNITNTAAIERGKELYDMHCRTCHQASGNGVPKLIPSIRKSDYVKANKSDLIQFVLYGTDPKKKKGINRSANTMPPHSHLSDNDIAALLSYIRANFDNKSGAITPEEVKKERKR